MPYVPYPAHSPRIIGVIKNIPTFDIGEVTKRDDLEEDPGLNAIRDRVREEAIDAVIHQSVSNPDVEHLKATAIKAYANSFRRYSMPVEVYERLGALLGLIKPFGRLQRQPPGNMATIHMDDLNIGYMRPYEKMNENFTFTQEEFDLFDANPSHAIRFLIMLQDRLPGQFVTMGDEVFDHWVAGSIIAFDWRTTPHSTMNAGFWERDLVRLTGLGTAFTVGLLDTYTEFDYHQKG